MLNKNLLNKENKNTCHPELVSRSTNVLSTQLKSAAMFGLDARIALAIFGALSVITGAALFSAIENSKATALLTEMQEVGKAWEAYYLDTRKNLPLKPEASPFNYIYESHNLIKNSLNLKGWKGPYLKYPIEAGCILKNCIQKKQGQHIHLIKLKNSNDWERWENGICTSNTDCSLWVYINNLSDKEILKKIDNMIDSGNGPSNGIFRWAYIDDPNTNWTCTLKYAPIAN